MNAPAYDFHGVRLELAVHDPVVAEALARRLKHFAAAIDGDPDMRYTLRRVPDGGEHFVIRPIGAGRPVYDAPGAEVTYFDEADLLYIDYADRARVLTAGATGEAICSARLERDDDPWLLSRPLFTIPFVDLLKRHGLFSVHAAAVASSSGAVLFAGGSGAGKSTLAVALALAGMSYLADDMVFLSGEGSSLRVHAFPDEADVTDVTAGFFPEVDALKGGAAPGWPKRSVKPEALPGAGLGRVCEPRALVFPRVGAGSASRLETLVPAEALLELAPNVLLTERESSQAHLDALGQLVRSVPSYRLSTARDFDRVAALIAAL